MKTIKYIIIASAVALFASCAVVPKFDSGAFLTTDDSGHLTKDQVYELGAYTISFLADGTYQEVGMSFETNGLDLDGDGVTGEGWVQDDGIKGTYVYDGVNFSLTINYSQSWDGSTAAWVSGLTNDNDTVQSVMDCLLTSEMFFGIDSSSFLKSTGANTWSYNSTDTKKNTAKNTSESTWTIDFTAMTMTRVNRSITYNATGEIAYSSGSRYNYIIDNVQPADSTWVKGETVAFNCLYTTYESGSTNNGTSWSDYGTPISQYEYTDFVFLNNETFILKDPTLLPGGLDF